MKILKNKKAAVIVIMAVLGLALGIGAYFGVKYVLEPEGRPNFVGEPYLKLISADRELDFERVFVQEASEYALSSAVFNLAKSGGLYLDSSCGQIEREKSGLINNEPVNIWAAPESKKFCFPETNSAEQEESSLIWSFKQFANSAMDIYLSPKSEIPAQNFEIEILSKQNPRQKQIIGKAKALRKKTAENFELAVNLSFSTELNYNFEDYSILTVNAKEMAEKIVLCRKSEKLNKCIEEEMEKINQKEIFAENKLKMHFDDCYNPEDAEKEKLAKAKDEKYVFCILKTDERKFIAYDSLQNSLEERQLEYRFGLDFTRPQTNN